MIGNMALSLAKTHWSSAIPGISSGTWGRFFRLRAGFFFAVFDACRIVQGPLTPPVVRGLPAGDPPYSLNIAPLHLTCMPSWLSSRYKKNCTASCLPAYKCVTMEGFTRASRTVAGKMLRLAHPSSRQATSLMNEGKVGERLGKEEREGAE